MPETLTTVAITGRLFKPGSKSPDGEPAAFIPFRLLKTELPGQIFVDAPVATTTDANGDLIPLYVPANSRILVYANATGLNKNGGQSVWLQVGETDADINDLVEIPNVPKTGMVISDHGAAFADRVSTIKIEGAGATAEEESSGVLLLTIPGGDEANLAFDSPLSRIADAVSIPQAGSGQSGYLSSADWQRFDNKQEPGGVQDASYVHSQLVASSLWNIQHNLGKMPAITIVDSGDNVVLGDVVYLDSNNAQASFSAPFGGKAYCN